MTPPARAQAVRLLLVRPLLLGAGLALVGCVQDLHLPELGPCSVLPDADAYDFGQVGIGTCLSGPTDLQVRPDPLDPDNHFLFVVNSDPSGNFSGSSLLSVDAGSIDLSCRVNGLHELRADALGMQEFAGRLAVDEEAELGLLTSRQTGGFEGSLNDVIYTIDVSDPRALAYSDLGPRAWGPYRYMQVPADPWSVAVNPASRRAYGLSLTLHEVFGLDLLARPIRYADLQGPASVSRARFEDVDGSGSAPDFELLGYTPETLHNETITITMLGGTTRLYFPADPGDGGAFALFRADSGDGGASFVTPPGGPEREPDAAWAEGGFGAASLARTEGLLRALVAGRDAAGVWTLGRLTASEHAVDWAIGRDPALAGIAGSWDEGAVFDPDLWLDGGTYHVVFAGGGDGGRGIGRAAGADLLSLERAGDPGLEDGAVLLPEPGTWEAGGLFGPSVLRNGTTGEWLLYYTGHDGAGPEAAAIGLARGDDGRAFAREADGPLGDSRVLLPGEPGAWDSVAVAAPSVAFFGGRFHMWYQGFDGSTWRTGLAHSEDGLSWARDARNPVLDGVLDPEGRPVRAFAFPANTGGLYFVEGSVGGPSNAFAFEGSDFASTDSPLVFRIVGGQALGRGPRGAFDRSGVESPAAPDLPGDRVLYVGLRSGARRLGVARRAGAGLVRDGEVVLQGFTGALEALNGPEASTGPTSLSVRADGSSLRAALAVDGGIALATGDASAEALVLTAETGELALAHGESGEFDDDAVRRPSLLLRGPSGGPELYYEAFDGNNRRIGRAVQAGDGTTFERVGGGPTFDRGAAGTWDDAHVGAPAVLHDEASGRTLMWYLGSDGAETRVGHAWSDDGGATWVRYRDAQGVPRPVFTPSLLAFSGEDVRSISVRRDGDEYELWFEGVQAGVSRIGRARSEDGMTWTPRTNPTTAGDRFVVETREGDTEESSGIYLGDGSSTWRTVGSFLVHGAGASDLSISPDGRWGVVSNKRSRHIVVLDLHDDGTEDAPDPDYHDIQAIFVIPQVGSRMVASREVRWSPDGRDLYVLLGPLVNPGSGDDSVRRGPEGLLRFDWTRVVEADEPYAILDAMTGWVPLARGNEEIVGYEDDVSVGPSDMAMRADGSRFYVTNFNDNSLYVIDPDDGARGRVVAMIDGLDEKPSQVALSPDERFAYVATIYGRALGEAANSTLQVIDVDEASPTFGQVLTTLSNTESRAEAGCE